MENIVSFEIITLRESGMRGICEYELTPEDGKAKVAFYFLRWNGREDERILSESAVVDMDEAVALLNKSNILSWDGFRGERPKGLLDGIDFRFTANVNGGKKVTASGSENFPKGYRTFTNGLYEMLRAKN